MEPLRFLGFLALIAILLAILPVDASQHEESQLIVQDPRGDVTTLGLTLDRSNALDLAALLLGSNGTHFQITIELADLDGATLFGKDFPTYLVFYSYEGRSYRMQIVRINPIGTTEIRYLGSLEVYNEATRTYDELSESPAVHPRESEDAIDIGVPYSTIQGTGGLLASPGFSITGIFVRSVPQGDDIDPLAPGIAISTSSDRMPDAGTASYRIEQRSFDGQDVLVFVARPQRLSNGGENVFAYSIQVSNSGADLASFEFSFTGVPDFWDASLADTFLEVPGHSTVNNTAVIRSPGAHQHGGQVNIQVQTKRIETGELWTNTISVTFTSPPQPAGHHPTLYFHAARNPNVLPGVQDAYGEWATAPYMNTLSEDESDVAEPVNSEFQNLRYWQYPLAPGLGIGLDFILDKTVRCSFTVAPRMFLPAGEATIPIRGVTMWAELKLVSEERGTILLADSNRAAIGDVATSKPIELDLVPTQESEFIPYHAGSNLILDIWFTTSEPFPGSNPESLIILPGGYMTLPLLDFQDPLPLVEGTPIILEAPTQVFGQAGLDIAVPVTLASNLGNTADVRLEARGANPAWNVRFYPSEVKLGGGEARTTTVGVHVPQDAVEGDILRFFVTASVDGLPTAIEPIIILIDDESTPTLLEKQSTKDTPYLSGFTVGIAFLAITIWRRSRNRIE